MGRNQNQNQNQSQQSQSHQNQPSHYQQNNPNFRTISIRVANDKVGLVIGKGNLIFISAFILNFEFFCFILSFLGGDNLRAIEKQSNAKLHLEPNSDNGETKAFTISGITL